MSTTSYVQKLPYPYSRLSARSGKKPLLCASNATPSLSTSTERKSRHWYDVDKLSKTAVGEGAIKDKGLLTDVVRHKQAFFHASKARYEDCLKGRVDSCWPMECLKSWLKTSRKCRTVECSMVLYPLLTP